MNINQIYCLFLIASFISTTHSADVNFIINGKISLNTCSVTVDSKNKYVSLGTWGSKQFSNTGMKTLPVPFTISLENCNGSVSGVSGVDITFVGRPILGNTAAFSLNGVSTAQNVGILILDKNKNIIEPNKKSIIYDLNSKESNISLSFYGQYISTSTPVNPGSANSDITFSITYN